MRVLYFMNHVGRGGAALALYDLIFELKQNYDIEIVVFTGKRNRLNEMLDSINVENYVAPYKNFMSSTHKPKRLWEILCRIRHDICLPIALWKINKDVQVSEFDIIHSNLNRIDIGAILAKKNQKPHLWHIREHGNGEDFDLISIKKDIAGYMEKFDSRYIVISKSVKNTWEKIGLPDEKIDLIYDGVCTEKLLPNEHPCDGITKILFLGGYDPAKGQGMLIDAIINLPINYRNKIIVDFFGNGMDSYREQLFKKVKDNALEKIIHLNRYDLDIYSKIGQYDIGINCSRCEGFGRVTIEYMLAGLCPLVTDTGANPELVINGITGYLFPYGNVKALSEKLLYLINHPSIPKRCGQHASTYARDNFSMKRHADLIYKEYEKLLIR